MLFDHVNNPAKCQCVNEDNLCNLRLQNGIDSNMSKNLKGYQNVSSMKGTYEIMQSVTGTNVIIFSAIVRPQSAPSPPRWSRLVRTTRPISQGAHILRHHSGRVSAMQIHQSQWDWAGIVSRRNIPSQFITLSPPVLSFTSCRPYSVPTAGIRHDRVLRKII